MLKLTSYAYQVLPIDNHVSVGQKSSGLMKWTRSFHDWLINKQFFDCII